MKVVSKILFLCFCCIFLFSNHNFVYAKNKIEYTKKDGAILYEKPSKKSKILLKKPIKNNTKIQIVSNTNQWVKVKYQNKIGYIQRQYVEQKQKKRSQKERNQEIKKFFENTKPTKNISLINFLSVDLNGDEIKGSQIKEKKVTMLTFWATFCGYCIQEMPDLEKLSNKYKGQDFQIIGIPVDLMDSNGQIIVEQLELAQEIAKKTGITYRNLLPTKELYEKVIGDIYTVPFTVLVDSKGQVLGQPYVGVREITEWEKIIKEYLKK